jgi:hypothetical protein
MRCGYRILESYFSALAYRPDFSEVREDKFSLIQIKIKLLS